MITALPPLAMQAGANRVVQGVKIEHVCGDPSLSVAADRALRRRLAEQALRALQTPLAQPTLLEAS